LFHQEALEEISFFETPKLSRILAKNFSLFCVTIEKETFPTRARAVAKLITHFLALNRVKSHLRSIDPLEEDLLSMILHWEVASGKIVTKPELLELKKLCKNKTLFCNLGYGPLKEQANAIDEWLAQAKDEQVFKNKVQDLTNDFSGTPKLAAMLFLTIFKADVVHALILKVIQLLNKISENKEMLKKFEQGKFDKIDKQIESIFKNNSEVKKIFEKLKASKNLEADITSLLLKMFDDSSSEMFRVSSCTKCEYKLFQNNERDKNEGIWLILLEISNGRYLEVSFC
jgi:hypothetical protein